MNVQLATLMHTTPSELANTQHDALKDYVLDIIEKVQTLIVEEKYDKVKELLVYSPAGDGYGSDNHFLNFDYSGHQDGMDIDEVLDMLINLKKQSQAKEKKVF